MAGNDSLWILQDHLKSKLGDPEKSDKRRTAQATGVSAILRDRYNLKTQCVIVAGDFNDTPDSVTLRRLLDNSGLLDALEVANVPADQRWTYSYRGRQDQIDHVLVSRALKEKVLAPGVDRSAIAEIAKSRTLTQFCTFLAIEQIYQRHRNGRNVGDDQ